MRRPAKFFIVTLVTVALTATAIAGAAADEQFSKKYFLKQANAVCKKAWKAIDANFAEKLAGLEANDEPSPAQIEAGVVGLVKILRAAATKVEALQGPASLERKVNTFLDRFNVVVDAFYADPQSAFAEELSGYPFAKPDKLARRIGLKDCVQRG